MTTKLRIRRLDPKNIVIERLVKAKKSQIERWEIAGYYGTVGDLSKALLNMAVDIPEADSLAELVRLLAENICKTEHSICEQLKRHQRDSSAFSGQPEPVVVEPTSPNQATG